MLFVILVWTLLLISTSISIHLMKTNVLHFSFWILFIPFCWDFAICAWPWTTSPSWGFSCVLPCFGLSFRGRFRVWCLGHSEHHAWPSTWSISRAPQNLNFFLTFITSVFQKVAIFWGKFDWFVGIFFNACKVPLHLELIWFSFDKLWKWLAFVCSELRPAWIRILAWRSSFDLLPQIDSCRWIRWLLIHTAQPFAIQLTRIMSSCYEKAVVQTIPFSFSLFAWQCILTKHTNLWQLDFTLAESGIRNEGRREM